MILSGWLFLVVPIAVVTCDKLGLYADVEHSPFIFGVASGEPRNDSVLIWTRAQDEDFSFTSSQQLTWSLWKKSDSLVIKSGVLDAELADDFTVVVEVDDLEADTVYEYQFTHVPSSKKSVIGRTRTAPNGGIDSIKIATLSCSSIWSGFLNSYDRLADNEDVNVILHLGDFIYPELDRYSCRRVPAGLDATCRNECSAKTLSVEESANVSKIVATHNCSASELERFRFVHRYYMHDPMLRRVRQTHPFVVIFDNHDLGPERTNRRNESGSIQAFLEYAPTRARLDDSQELFSQVFEYGDFVQVLSLDSRAVGPSNESIALMASESEFVSEVLDQSNENQWRVIMTTTAFAPWAVNGWDVFVNSIFGGVFVALFVLALICVGFECRARRKEKLLAKEAKVDCGDTVEDQSKSSVDEKRAITPKKSIVRKMLTCCAVYGVCNVVILIIVWVTFTLVVTKVAASRNVRLTSDGGGLTLVAGQSRNWDGNPQMRRDFLNLFREANRTTNNVWVSGDLHMSLASDVRDVDYRDTNSFENAERFGVEMLSSSVSRANVDEIVSGLAPGFPLGPLIDIGHTILFRANPHFRYFEATQHGYGLLTFTRENVTGEFWYTPKNEPADAQFMAKRLVCLKDSNQWVEAD